MEANGGAKFERSRVVRDRKMKSEGSVSDGGGSYNVLGRFAS